MKITGSAAVRTLREDHLGASTFLEKGWHLIAQGDFPGAEAALGAAIDLAPTDQRAHALLGWAIMRQGRYDDAQQILERVLASDASNAMARASLGYVHLRKEMMPEAAETLHFALRQRSDPKAVLYGNFYLGLLHSAAGEVDIARKFFETSIELGPSLIEAYYELGRTWWKAGDDAEADRVWMSGNSANRFSVWGRRCAEAMRLVRAGEEPHSYS